MELTAPRDKYREEIDTVNFECPKNHFMKWMKMKSSYKNHYGDRQWDFGCEEQPFNYDTKKCKWTGSLADSPGGLGGRPPPILG